MTYLNAVKYILSLPSGNDCFTDPALHERMHSVASRLGDPQKQIKFIHVCGDVGKGSCSAMLDSILGHMSYKRGLFSYHDGDDPRSTIIMDGRQASYDEFTGAVSLVKNTYKELFGQLLPYAEEAMTLAAILCFRNHGCDIAILEKHDPTGDPSEIAGPPELLMITQILARSASESKGLDDIVRKGTAETVSSPQHKEIYNSISLACAVSGCRLTLPIYSEMEIEGITLFKTAFRYRGNEYSVHSFSPCQTVNAITAIEAAHALERAGIRVESDAITKGIASANLGFTCETLSIDPTVILSSSWEVNRIDTLVASLAQVKDIFSHPIKVYVDSTCLVNTSLLSEQLSAYGIEISKVLTVYSDNLESKQLRSQLCPIFSEAKALGEAAPALIFIGRKPFLHTAKELMSQCMGI